MRIIAGAYGGRVIQSPHSAATHPMSDKVRGALFNMLGDITGLTVLDAFAGSGAVGLEALSRGAAQVTFIDNDRQAHRTIIENIASLGVDEATKAIQAGLSSWSERNKAQKFDIIIADPPYDRLQKATLDALTQHLASSGVLALSWPGKQAAPTFKGVQAVTERSFGDAQLLFYKA